MRLVFAGTPAVAVPSLRALSDSAHEVTTVITRADAPLGRKRVLTPSPVAEAAAGLGIPLVKADSLDAAVTAEITRAAPDLGVVVAYGGLVREPLLSTPVHGWINLHFSLLPRWRGAAPVQRALIAGDPVTGAAVFQLVPELDEGEVYDELRYPVPSAATAGEVLAELAEQGAGLLASVVDAIAAGTAVSAPQRGEPTYAEKLTAEDGRIDWQQDADAVLSLIRGTTPEPGAFTTVAGARLKVLLAGRAGAAPELPPARIAEHGGEVLVGTAGVPIALVRVQPAGKAAMPAGDWWRGQRLTDPVAGS